MNVQTKVRSIGALLTLLATCTSAFAQNLPLWELGGGAAALRVPDYRGSEEVRNYLLPVPWLVYRGEIFRADRDGVRARLFDSERADLNLSINGSVPVDSDRNRARQGMEDLRPLFEFGPVANIHLWRTADQRAALDLRLPARAAFTFRDGVRHVGYVFAPQLNLDLRWPSATAADRWNLGLLVEVPFSDRRLNGYFYSVSAADATATRPEYRARSGYGGWQALAALSHRVDRWWFGGFIKYDNLTDAVFADSPLVTQRRQVSGGFAVSYVFARSATMVPPRER
jgi:outer membrane scaffolding protein for murein synthesis (MipA/OmpV family)